DVSMDDPPFVGISQPGENAGGNPGGGLRQEGFIEVCETLGQVLHLDVRDREDVDRVDLHDVWMRQFLPESHLLQEGLSGCFVVGDRNLHRYRPAVVTPDCGEDLSEPASPDEGDPVVT